jgi:hypothetical protein
MMGDNSGDIRSSFVVTTYNLEWVVWRDSVGVGGRSCVLDACT